MRAMKDGREGQKANTKQKEKETRGEQKERGVRDCG